MLEITNSISLFGSVPADDDTQLLVCGTDPLLAAVWGIQVQTAHFNAAFFQADIRCQYNTTYQIVH
jgi:hypothetical protein